MKKLIVIMLLAVALIVYPVSSAMAYGGEGGDGGGEDEVSSEDTSLPDGLISIDMSGWDTPRDEDYDTRSDDLSSVGPTRPTQGTRQWEDMSPEEQQILIAISQVEANMLEEVVVSGGAILIGYATGGFSVYVQAAAAGTWTGSTTLVLNIVKDEDKSYAYGISKDALIAFIPVKPEVQVLIGKGVDKVKDVVMQAPSIQHPSRGPGGFAPTYAN